MGKISKNTYVISLNTKGLTEYYTSQSLTKARNQINEVLKSVSLTYDSKMLIKARSMQLRLKKGSTKISIEIENTKITINKAIRL